MVQWHNFQLSVEDEQFIEISIFNDLFECKTPLRKLKQTETSNFSLKLCHKIYGINFIYIWVPI